MKSSPQAPKELWIHAADYPIFSDAVADAYDGRRFPTIAARDIKNSIGALSTGLAAIPHDANGLTTQQINLIAQRAGAPEDSPPTPEHIVQGLESIVEERDLVVKVFREGRPSTGRVVAFIETSAEQF